MTFTDDEIREWIGDRKMTVAEVRALLVKYEKFR